MRLRELRVSSSIVKGRKRGDADCLYSSNHRKPLPGPAPRGGARQKPFFAHVCAGVFRLPETRMHPRLPGRAVVGPVGGWPGLLNSPLSSNVRPCGRRRLGLMEDSLGRSCPRRFNTSWGDVTRQDTNGSRRTGPLSTGRAGGHAAARYAMLVSSCRDITIYHPIITSSHKVTPSVAARVSGDAPPAAAPPRFRPAGAPGAGKTRAGSNASPVRTQ